jgi:hypothetical protein
MNPPQYKKGDQLFHNEDRGISNSLRKRMRTANLEDRSNETS